MARIVYRGLTLPMLTTEQIWDAVNGKGDVYWHDNPVITRLSERQKEEVNHALETGWVVVAKDASSVSNTFFHLAEAASRPHIKIRRHGQLSTVSMDLITMARSYLTMKGTEFVYRLFHRLAQPKSFTVVGSYSSVSHIRRPLDEEIAAQLLATSRDGEMLSSIFVDTSAFWHVLNREANRPQRYEEYLASPMWLKRRAETLRRANHRCQLCGRRDSELQAHHNNYESFGEEQTGDLIALCVDCHRLADQRRRAQENRGGQPTG